MYDWLPKEALPEPIIGSIQRGVAQIISKYKNSKALPASLYHYTDATGLKGIIEGGYLRATHVAFMNDAREFLHAVSLLLDAVRLRQKQSTSALVQRTLSDLESFIAPTSAESAPAIFVTCFTGEDNSLNQWRAYGKGEGGYSLGFDPIRMQQTARSGTLMPVLYDERTQRGAVDELLDWSLSEYEKLSQQNEEFAGDEKRVLWWTWLLATATQLAPMMKDKSFQAEAEWRYTLWCNSQSEMDFVPRPIGLVPFTRFEFGEPREGKPSLLPVTKLYSGPGRATKSALLAGRTLLEKFEYYGVPIEASAIPYRVS